MYMTKTELPYFLTGDAKNVHCAICAFWQYAGFSQIQCGFLCPHMCSCDDKCYDYNNGHVCKHIHRVHSMTHQDLEGSTPSQELHNDFDNISYAESMFDPQKGTQLINYSFRLNMPNNHRSHNSTKYFQWFDGRA